MGKRAAGSVVFMVGLLSVASGMFFQEAGSGMVGFWRLEETSSPSMDSSGNNYTSAAWPTGVTSLPGPANTPSQLGANSTACLQFDGTSAALVSFPGTSSVDLTGDFTVAIWVYKTADNANWVRYIGKGAIGIRTFGVWQEPVVSPAVSRILFQQMNGPGSYFVNFFSTGTIPLNTWTHVACRVSGSDRRIYINGASSGNVTVAGAAQTDTTPVTLGYPGFENYYTGRMDDVRLYNRALSDSDIAAIAAGGQGPPAPTGLSASTGSNSVTLTWSGSATVYNVKRSTTSGGPYTTVASNISALTYTDNTVTGGTTYYYVVSGVTYGEGPNSTETSVTPPLVSALPNTGLVTSEAGGTASFNIVYNQPSPAASVLQCVSNDITAGLVSTTFPGATSIPNGFQVNVGIGTNPTIPVTVTGVDDFIVTPDRAYTVSVSATGIPGPTTPDVHLTNLETDSVGILLSKSSVTTTTAGGQDTFSVSLNSSPATNTQVTIAVTSSDSTEATVSPATLTFTQGNWNSGLPVTVTGVGVNLTYINTPFTISLAVEPSPPAPASPAPDPNYVALTAPPAGPVLVSGTNIHLEVAPALPKVWGGSSGGGCGLLGLEIGLPLLFLRRRRRRLS